VLGQSSVELALVERLLEKRVRSTGDERARGRRERSSGDEDDTFGPAAAFSAMTA